ncbi:RNA polymerase sigma-70 factor [Flavilitoribacter nigricans]|uniref:HTH luxR-type domain-containing protein n=1 Tax=Flavilitoribacter nigricans (strain ATCC 23147 / DSM 23189 / NBRC 102662 / NCIMB 1420 / SS-2) TaxID=1122177 RepID=A0A2D0NBR8_FLAN2|nr:RNA polymerase sigma-70 factor [Flavilitoribacter nigricans]PHN05935.1 hypothetical protein CRP01_13225 [Flavilitoribacter nigricans DSM 23189 = NBRC 102662]
MDQTEAKRRAIISRLKNSDISAFDDIYRAYASRLFGFALNLVKSQKDAEGIVQEVFLKLWKNREKIDLHTSFDSYLFTITYNTVVSLLRKRSSEKKYIDYVQSIQIPRVADSSVDELEWRELQDQVNSIVDQLPARQQEVFRLSREEGMTHAEIAEALNISINTVENHMGRALKFIRSRLTDHHSLKVLLFISLFF